MACQKIVENTENRWRPNTNSEGVHRKRTLDTMSNSPFVSQANTVEPRFNKVPRDWENWFIKSRVRYIEVRFLYILL